MKQVEIHEAQSNLSRIVEQVEHGEEIVIARNGKPIALLSIYVPVLSSHRQPGSLKGKIRIAEDFDAPDAVTE